MMISAVSRDATPAGGLYASVTRGRIDDLPTAVRRFHYSDSGVRAVGAFDVKHGTSPLARVVAIMLRLPAEGRSRAVVATITRRGGIEEWRRSIGGRTLRTQQQRSGSLLAERMGPFELLFRIEIEGGALVFTTEGAAIRFAMLRLPLLPLFRPRVSARVTSATGSGMVVEVAVALPFVGTLLSYHGTIEEVMP